MGSQAQRARATVAHCLLLMSVTGCTVTTRVANQPGRTTTYENPASPGRLAGAGVESQDIISMTDHMVRDMIATPILAGRPEPPNVIIDARYFRNETTSRLNVHAITDRLRVELNRAARGRMSFVARHYGEMVENERWRKRTGTVAHGAHGRTEAAAGGDYRLGGRVTSLQSTHSRTGMTSRYYQFVFEMVDLETGEIVWSGIYELRKAAPDDVIYR